MQEFLIRTSRTGVPDVHVSRRYGDFKRLSDEVSYRTLLPDLELISASSSIPRLYSTKSTSQGQDSHYGSSRTNSAIRLLQSTPDGLWQCSGVSRLGQHRIFRPFQSLNASLRPCRPTCPIIARKESIDLESILANYHHYSRRRQFPCSSFIPLIRSCSALIA
jgi:hypothetical protein